MTASTALPTALATICTECDKHLSGAEYNDAIECYLLDAFPMDVIKWTPVEPKGFSEDPFWCDACGERREGVTTLYTMTYDAEYVPCQVTRMNAICEVPGSHCQCEITRR